jgi:tRNA pseudouridine55 synthase
MLMNGFLIIDKPAGLTSFDVIRQLRRSCKIRRVGHAGTLDPMATGVLPVAFGFATRLIEYLMAGEKVYRASMLLGAETDTQDAEGQILSTGAWAGVSRDQLMQACDRMTGLIHQTPPMYSALKRDGKPLYQLAREGIEVPRQARQIRIEAIRVDRFEPPEVDLRVTCGKGTYIRTLCHDLGRRLGCGAHLTALRREKNGIFDLRDSHPLQEIIDLAAAGASLPIISPAEALADWPGLIVGEEAAGRLKNGVAPRLEEVSGRAESGQCVRLLVRDRLAAVARVAADSEKLKTGDFELLKVFETPI